MFLLSIKYFRDKFRRAVLLEDVWDNTCQWAVGSVESQQLKPENQVCFPKTLTPHIAFIILLVYIVCQWSSTDFGSLDFRKPDTVPVTAYKQLVQTTY